MAWPGGLMSEARRKPSPNIGGPMVAIAFLLGLQLGKPGVYTLNAKAREPAGADVQRSAARGSGDAGGGGGPGERLDRRRLQSRTSRPFRAQR